MQLGNVLRMQQRSSKMSRVKVWPTVPIEVRQGAERIAGDNLRNPKRFGPKTVNAALEHMLLCAHKIIAARTDLEVLDVVQQLRGKPLALPAKDGAQ